MDLDWTWTWTGLGLDLDLVQVQVRSNTNPAQEFFWTGPGLDPSPVQVRSRSGPNPGPSPVQVRSRSGPIQLDSVLLGQLQPTGDHLMRRRPLELAAWSLPGERCFGDFHHFCKGATLQKWKRATLPKRRISTKSMNLPTSNHDYW